MAEVLAPLLSIMTLSSRLCCRTTFLKKRRAIFLSRWTVSRKSMVVLVDGTVEILALDLDVYLVHPFAPTRRFFAFRKDASN